ncbi:putative Arylsulfatase J [Hypsibius exemplaris]|uniref:Arylsulfatase J n=1 Tax=Hypsibius exemplaris TaxID=2072580 RepID=A0A1W0WRA1_HYPEX|nr:putative Arylsulfatase J [Hypsibius exemplaris]
MAISSDSTTVLTGSTGTRHPDDIAFSSKCTKQNICYSIVVIVFTTGVVMGILEGSLQTPTPNIDRLAWDGIILNRHYTHPVCSPTRSALLTGKYAFQVGISNPSSPGEPYGIPLQFKLLPQYLKDLNYNTYMLGKLAPEVNRSGRNLYENGLQVAESCTNNHYLPHMLTEKFEQIVHNNGAEHSKPFFVYFASPLPKANSEANGTYRVNRQFVMPQYLSRPSVRAMDNEHFGRKQQMGQIQALDEQVKRIKEALECKGVLNKTIIIFMSDNGAAPMVLPTIHVNHGSNWPLRMFRGSPFEGGVRNLAFIWSKLLKKKGIVTDQLFHVADWLPTLYEAAGGNVSDLPNLTGISQWTSLKEGTKKGDRTELVALINPVRNVFGFVYQEPGSGTLYKIVGGPGSSHITGWYKTEGTNATLKMVNPTSVSVNCGHPEGIERTVCQPWLADCLFDLTNDPCELNNIAAAKPEMVNLMKNKVVSYNATAYPSVRQPYDPTSNPELFQNWWTPWQDPEPVRKASSCLPFQSSFSL